MSVCVSVRVCVGQKEGCTVDVRHEAKLILICTFWMLRSMLSGRLNRNLKRCRTLSAFRVESALSFRPKTSWKRVSAVSLAPMRNQKRRRN